METYTDHIFPFPEVMCYNLNILTLQATCGIESSMLLINNAIGMQYVTFAMVTDQCNFIPMKYN